MECPYCKKEMAKGYVPETRGAVEWYPEEVNQVDTYAYREYAIRLSPGGMIVASQAAAWYCEECRTVIIPVQEFESTGAKLKKKLDDFMTRVDDAVERQGKAREEQKKEKAREKRQKKDPWEV